MQRNNTVFPASQKYLFYLSLFDVPATRSRMAKSSHITKVEEKFEKLNVSEESVEDLNENDIVLELCEETDQFVSSVSRSRNH